MINPSKREQLFELEKEMAADKLLPLGSNLVFGEGDPESEVMFIGEAPGYYEDVQKRPFVGRSGQLLRECIRAAGWKENDVYITNIVKRRPPENRDPLPDEIEAYQPYLARQIEIIEPKIIVALGRFSMNHFLPLAKITRDHGKVFRVAGRLIVPLYHPAAALRNPAVMKAFRERFLALPQILRQWEELMKKSPVAAPLAREAKSKQDKLF